MTRIDPFAPGDSPLHPANVHKRQDEGQEPVRDPQVQHYESLLALYGTADEQRAAAQGDDAQLDALPDVEELEEREAEHGMYRLRLDLFGSEEEKARDDWTHWQLHERFAYPDAPGSGALKADWVTYAERIAHVRGEDIPRNEQGEPGTIAQLQEYTAQAHHTEDVARLERAEQQGEE